MSNLVVDSSVVVKWFFPEPYSTEAHRILNDYQSGLLTLLAPDLVIAEFGNIVWKKQAFQGIAPRDAQLVIDTFRSLSLVQYSSTLLLDSAYGLAVLHKRTVYDMLYLALSLQETCQFVTADERLVNAISSDFPNIVWLGNWP